VTGDCKVKVTDDYFADFTEATERSSMDQLHLYTFMPLLSSSYSVHMDVGSDILQ